MLIASQELHFVKIVHNVANGMQKTFFFFSLFQLIKCRDTQLTQRDLCDKYSLLPLRPYWDHLHHTRKLTELQWRCSKLTLSRCHCDLTWSILRVTLHAFCKVCTRIWRNSRQPYRDKCGCTRTWWCNDFTARASRCFAIATAIFSLKPKRHTLWFSMRGEHDASI